MVLVQRSPRGAVVGSVVLFLCFVLFCFVSFRFCGGYHPMCCSIVVLVDHRS